MADEIGAAGRREIYVSRLHDKQLDALVRSKRLGNYLLVGRSGSGKTSSLLTLSDRLIDAGLEHQLIPCSLEKTFVPPMAKINLVDDLDIFNVFNYSDRRLIDSLNASTSRSLNIITARLPEALHLRLLLRISGEMSIASLSQSESMEFYKKFVAQRGGPQTFDASFLELFRSQIEMGQFRDPVELDFGARGLLDDGGVSAIAAVCRILDSKLSAQSS